MEAIKEIKSLCEKYGIRPLKKLGQNFLINANVARMIIDHANLDANDLVVEVGPGLGTLTLELAKRAKKVLAVEIDPNAVRAARAITAGDANIEIIEKDILKLSNAELTEILSSPQYKVVASLPYNLTSLLLRKFTEDEPRPSVCVFLVQKEVAQRVCAKPGEMSVLSVAVQFYGKPELIAVVKRGAFWPQPEVDSAILKIGICGGRASGQTEARPRDIDEKRFFQIVRIGFSARRKQLQNNLMSGLHLPREKVIKILEKLGLSPQVRAQELSVEEWVCLAEEIGK
ncbi:ribosomal RNA small subunit methyltransferase A [Candidatus Uhrbacteria bacterium]|nr:ribosomal RNA small subunit methyltransferase A [Candidatus Uhrbacteria bacterium]